VLITVLVKPGACFWEFQICAKHASIELGLHATFETHKLRLSAMGEDVACARAYDYATSAYVTAHENHASTLGSGHVFGEWALERWLQMNIRAGNFDIDM
jgi:hypothetical protein